MDIKPFTVAVDDATLTGLKQRLERTRWADDFGNDAWQYGTNTAYLKELVAYWRDHYDWRKHEKAINAWQPSHNRMPVVEAPTATTATTAFAGELVVPPRKWAERYYNLKRFTPFPRGGHFAAAEEPQAIIDDVRAFYRTLR